MSGIGHAIKSRWPGMTGRVVRIGQRLGVNITPHHFYSEIPDYRHLETHDYWRQPLSMHDIQGATIEPQLAMAQELCGPYVEKLQGGQIHAQASHMNGEPGFGIIEADMLYCYLRALKPRRIVQVGCGVSTAVTLIAAADEPDYHPQIVCVDPYPTKLLHKLATENKITLVPQMAQVVPLQTFTDLVAGDLLFIDSTHTLRVGSEVIQLICEVLPRLRQGVRVHLHDIPFPYSYAPRVLTMPFISREPVLLYGFLVSNPNYRIDVSMSMLHYAEPDAMRKILAHYDPMPTEKGVSTGLGHFPSSIYLRVVDERRWH
ncbi:MAG: class I SAM-dependent methyltransferase [Phycisphaeraceae bacterium]|nr:class I SAM-dependent methyltransferase [Phycisphaeraceae bacterium]